MVNSQSARAEPAEEADKENDITVRFNHWNEAVSDPTVDTYSEYISSTYGVLIADRGAAGSAHPCAGSSQGANICRRGEALL